MTIYVLRSDNLIKIGHSGDVATRARAIIASVPVPVEFVGYMPGDIAVEQHLHTRFDQHRFSGEWFVETPEMTAVFDALLIKGIPARKSEPRVGSRVKTEAETLVFISVALRSNGADRWPSASHADRITNISRELGWPLNRVKDLYYRDPRLSVRKEEFERIEAWAGSAMAFAIAPELKQEEAAND